jgi:2'-5' RNA ligase
MNVRLFVALPLPRSACDELVGLVTPWQRRAWPVRWVPPASLHLTLHFLGEVSPEAEPALQSALERSADGTGPLDLVPGAVEWYPSRRRPRVLWLALEPLPALELLAHRVARGLAGQEAGLLTGTFRPHVTLGRVRPDATVPASARDEVAAAVLPSPWQAERVVLYQSELDGGPPRYLERHTVMLQA